ncbi:MAG: hypothetical protein K0R06_1351 [Clostridium sp.]|jgi:hypothetical protein|nr:hypothetical protein [Clostridium sp.]
MMKKSGIIENFTKGTQNKINNIIPDKEFLNLIND